MSHQQELQPTALPRAGDILLGRYVVEGVVTRGGFATIYRGRQLGVDRTVAIKCLDPESVHLDPAAPQRFAREAKLSSGLVHPNTITIFDYGRTKKGILFLVMEYVEGVSLNRVLRYGRIAPDRATHLIKQILQSLREAHSKGIIHRDLKPANIMVCDRAGEQDVIKVVDFGIAKALGEQASGNLTAEITGADRVIGTPRYMAPEQLAGEAVSAATDLYSVGLMLFEMLAGEPAVDKGSSLENMTTQLSEEPIPIPSSVPLPYRELLERAIAKDPRKRFQSADDLIIALESVDHAGLAAAAPPPAPSSPRISREVAEARTLSIPRDVIDELRSPSGVHPAIPMDPSGSFAVAAYAGQAPGKPRLLLLFNVLLAVLLVAVGVTLGVILVTQATSRDQAASRAAIQVAAPSPAPPSTYAVPGGSVLTAPDPTPGEAAPALTPAPTPVHLEVEAARMRLGEALLTAANTAEPLVFVFQGSPPEAGVFLGPDRLGRAGEPLTILRQRLPAEIEIATPGYRSAVTWLTEQSAGAIQYDLTLEDGSSPGPSRAGPPPVVAPTAPVAVAPPTVAGPLAPAVVPPTETAAAPTSAVLPPTEPVPAAVSDVRPSGEDVRPRVEASAPRETPRGNHRRQRTGATEPAEPEETGSRIMRVDEVPPPTAHGRDRGRGRDREAEREPDEDAEPDSVETPTALSPL